MNDEQPNGGQPAIKSALLDRMVDGELSPGEQRELLARIACNAGELASDPWRRLALAYVEAQNFGSEFRGIVRDEPSPHEPPATTRQSRQSLAACDSTDLQTLASSARVNGQNPSQAIRLLAIAAALLLAFGLGLMWPSDAPQNRVDSGHLAGRQPAPNRIDSTQQQENRLAADHPQTRRPTYGGLPDDHPLRRPYLELTLDGESSPIRVPIFNVSEVSRQWAESEPMAIPPYIRDELVRRGHRVRQRRRFVPVQLEGGQQVVIPVDEADVQFVDHRSYQ